MLRAMLTLASVFAVVGAGSPAVAGGCKGCDLIAKKGEGFCCGKGKIFSVELTSRKLYDALAGKDIDTDKIKCPGCKLAAEKSGKCDHCKIGAAQGKLFHSMVAYALAKGTPVHADTVAHSHCIGCKTAYKDNGFCKDCAVGFVSGRAFKGKESYDAALAANKTLVKAVEASKKCEACAVAMVTDGSCPHCNVSFKEGKKTG